MHFPVCPHPVTQRRLADPEFPRHLSNSTRSFHHHPRGFLTKLRRIVSYFPWQQFPSFPVKILKDPQSGKIEAPYLPVEAGLTDAKQAVGSGKMPGSANPRCEL